MLPYEEHLRAGAAEFKVPESPLPPKARGMRGRKPLPRGRRPAAKAKEKRITAPAASPSNVSEGKRRVRPRKKGILVLKDEKNEEQPLIQE